MNIRRVILSEAAYRHYGYAKDKLFELEDKRAEAGVELLKRILFVEGIFIELYASQYVHRIIMWGGDELAVFLKLGDPAKLYYVSVPTATVAATIEATPTDMGLFFGNLKYVPFNGLDNTLAVAKPTKKQASRTNPSTGGALTTDSQFVVVNDNSLSVVPMDEVDETSTINVTWPNDNARFASAQYPFADIWTAFNNESGMIPYCYFNECPTAYNGFSFAKLTNGAITSWQWVPYAPYSEEFLRFQLLPSDRVWYRAVYSKFGTRLKDFSTENKQDGHCEIVFAVQRLSEYESVKVGTQCTPAGEQDVYQTNEIRQPVEPRHVAYFFLEGSSAPLFYKEFPATGTKTPIVDVWKTDDGYYLFYASDAGWELWLYNSTFSIVASGLNYAEHVVTASGYVVLGLGDDSRAIKSLASVNMKTGAVVFGSEFASFDQPYNGRAFYPVGDTTFSATSFAPDLGNGNAGVDWRDVLSNPLVPTSITGISATFSPMVIRRCVDGFHAVTSLGDFACIPDALFAKKITLNGPAPWTFTVNGESVTVDGADGFYRWFTNIQSFTRDETTVVIAWDIPTPVQKATSLMPLAQTVYAQLDYAINLSIPLVDIPISGDVVGYEDIGKANPRLVINPLSETTEGAFPTVWGVEAVDERDPIKFPLQWSGDNITSSCSATVGPYDTAVKLARACSDNLVVVEDSCDGRGELPIEGWLTECQDQARSVSGPESNYVVGTSVGTYSGCFSDTPVMWEVSGDIVTEVDPVTGIILATNEPACPQGWCCGQSFSVTATDECGLSATYSVEYPPVSEEPVDVSDGQAVILQVGLTIEAPEGGSVSLSCGTMVNGVVTDVTGCCGIETITVTWSWGGCNFIKEIPAVSANGVFCLIDSYTCASSPSGLLSWTQYIGSPLGFTEGAAIPAQPGATTRIDYTGSTLCRPAGSPLPAVCADCLPGFPGSSNWPCAGPVCYVTNTRRVFEWRCAPC